MATNSTIIRVKHDVPGKGQVGHLPSSDSHGGINSIINWLARILGGTTDGVVEVVSDAAVATTDVTAGSVNGTIAIDGGTALAGNGADATARAANAVANINADATASAKVVATTGPTAGHFTLTAREGGIIGNAISIICVGTGWSPLALTRLAGGTDGNGIKTYQRGM